MTEDYVVSCWEIPTQGRRGDKAYHELLERYAAGMGGSLKEDPQGYTIVVTNPVVILSPGDTLCRYLSGRWGIKRGGR